MTQSLQTVHNEMMKTADAKTIEQEVRAVESRKGVNHSLQQMRAWLDEYLPEHHKLKSVQIAGTNGKGSVCRWLEMMAQNRQLKPAVFTSPHLISHFERMRVDGKDIAPEEWHEIYSRWKDFFERENFTMFEIDFWMAVDWFLQKGTGLAIMETGLGGERDAVTALDHQVKAITNIGLDHTAWLGDTREKIAETKGRIARKNVPLLTAERDPSCLSIIGQCAREAGTWLEQIHPDFHDWPDHLPLYQRENLALAMGTARALRMKIFPHEYQRMLQEFSWTGRFTVLRTDPLMVVDGAHNIDGIRALVSSCRNRTFEKIYFSVLADKNGRAMIRELQTVCREIVLVDFDNYRMADLQQLAWETGLETVSFDQMMEELKDIKKNTLVCGSLYFAGELLSRLQEREKEER